MNYKTINKKLHIENSSYNIDDIDFIMLNGKIRIYMNDGESYAIASGYTNEEKISMYADIAYSLKRNFNFVSLKGYNLINLNNIKHVRIVNKNELLIQTIGFSLQLTNLKDEEIQHFLEMKTKDNII